MSTTPSKMFTIKVAAQPNTFDDLCMLRVSETLDSRISIEVCGEYI